MNITEIIATIRPLAPPELGEPVNPVVLKDLRALTVDLIAAYRASGLLQGDPFADARNRSIHLHEGDVRDVLSHGTVLITGGSGCVGTALGKRLLELGVRRIVSLDRVSPQAPLAAAPQFAFYDCDLFDFPRLLSIFQQERPRIVFHLGAQRDPGLAERQIRDTIQSNVSGTANVIRACHEMEVGHCVFSSTGKASRYFTSEVYAASKKLAEWQIMQASLEGSTNFSAVRFTHMLDNSLVCGQIDARVAQGRPVNVHAPHRYVIAQSAKEAVHLLLNSLLFSTPGKPKMALVRNLGWPAETLEYALHRIEQSGKKLPLFFQGTPSGYEESFFAGQISWDVISDIHPLVNVLEDHTRTHDSSGETLLIDPAPFDGDILDDHVAHLTAGASDQMVSEAELKWANARAVRDVALSAMDAAPLNRVLQILRWGTDSKRLEKTGDSLFKHREMISFLSESIQPRRDPILESAVGFRPGEIAAMSHAAESSLPEDTPARFATRAAC